MPRKTRARVEEHECRCCGEAYEAKRRDARYCSPKCRQTMSRMLRAAGAKRAKKVTPVTVPDLQCRDCGQPWPLIENQCWVCGSKKAPRYQK